MILETIMIAIIGTLLHFTYEWSNHNKIVGLFSAVNESTWEHIKMSLSAVFLCSLVDGMFWGSNPNYFFGKFVSLLIITLFIPLIFYSYTALTKKTILFVDISSFYITIIGSQVAFNFFLNAKPLPYIFNYLGVIGMFILFGFYMVVTLFPIKNFIFKDPITKEFGLKGHGHK